MKLEKFLGIWQLNRSGKSIPIDYTVLCREIEKLCPDLPGFKTVKLLEEHDFIHTLPNGFRILTKKGLVSRVPLRSAPEVFEKSTEKNWTRFRRLCFYYADCVTQSDKVQEYLFESELNTKYLLPVLPIDWIDSNNAFNIKTSVAQKPAANRIKCRTDDIEDIYIGYPLSAFKGSNNKIILTPILLLPVDLSFEPDCLKVQIRTDEIDINRSWLEFNIPREEQKNIFSSICFSEGEKTGLIQPESAIRYLASRFKIELNPNYLDYNPVWQPKKIVNSAALFAGNPLKFSKTLKKELLEIAEQPTEILDKTALAFVFRDPPLTNQYEVESDLLPLDFLENHSNKEQFDAVNQGLNQPLSKVTGPPGTGKSQVAVNLIANYVFYGKSALFTSKNHKAVHAIFDRAEKVMPELPLVQFCSTEDGGSGAKWSNQPIDLLIARCEAIRQEYGISKELPLLRSFEDTLENFQDAKSLLNGIDSTRKKLQDIQAKLELITPKISLPVKQINEKYASYLQEIVKKIDFNPKPVSWMQKLLSLLLFKRQKAEKAEHQLRQMLPEISAFTPSSKRFQERVLRLCADISDYLAVKKEEFELNHNDLDLPAKVATSLAKQIRLRRTHLKAAFIAKRVLAINGVSESVRQKLKDATKRISRHALPFLKNILPASSIYEAQDAFQQFSRFFPAWAVTLLSLNKASPCIPGLFDRVIIDEASQCEIPPMIPALYRAKGVTLIGDPAQFPPVITMRESRHAHLRFVKHKLIDLSDENFDFLSQNAYSVVNINPVMLRDHFRCHPDIVDNFNEPYYHGKLRARTQPASYRFPQNLGFKPGVEWINVKDSLECEIEEVKKLVRELRNKNFEGTIGIISPFKKIAYRLREELNVFNQFIKIQHDINTVNGFQGGERDLIILMMSITNCLTRGEEWYVASEENSYIFNVAISRAKACLIVVGDRDRVSNSKLPALRRLAKVKQRPPKKLSQSPGEEILYKALCAEGIRPEQQYPLAGRYLDMALVNEKIDIEVDGEGFHLNKYGERKQDDIYRDLQISSLGWQICRLWYREVRDDPKGCVAKVKQMIMQQHNKTLKES